MRQNSITSSEETTKIFKYIVTVTIETYKKQLLPKFVWVINDSANGMERTGSSSIIFERMVIKKKPS